MNFYVYRYIRLDTNTPFYVGKGCGKRAYKKSDGRNRYFKNIMKFTQCRLEFVAKNLTEKQAFDKEIELIRLYKSLGYCEANMSVGGEGSAGVKKSEVVKEKISIANKGKHASPSTEFKPGTSHWRGRKQSAEHIQKRVLARAGKPSKMKGRPLSEEHKEKLSKAALGRKKSAGHVRNHAASIRRRKKVLIDGRVRFVLP